MSDSSLNISYLTAGAGGMYCGSCLNDNSLARALVRQGLDVQLLPLYTPIRTEGEDVSVDHVFFGGINVFLQQKFSLFRYLPPLLDRMLDQPWLINWAVSRAVETDPKKLGGLTVSMLRGKEGFQRKEVKKLCDWLARSSHPDIVCFSNMLIAGCAPALKKKLDVPILVILQGDDIFLDRLAEPHRDQAFREIRRLVDEVDMFVVYSRYYAEYMADYFSIPPEKIEVVPLGLEVSDFRFLLSKDKDAFDKKAEPGQEKHPPTIGYLARLAPEKGLHVLVDAFIELRRRPGMEQARLHIAGWLGEANRSYTETEFEKLKAAGLEDSFQVETDITRRGKLTFLENIDVLSVPTTYHEPKGLFVLEALAAGVPVVQPDHGAFPEILEDTQGGRLVRSEDPQHLAEVLQELLTDHAAREQLGQAGMQAVHQRRNADTMASAMIKLFDRLISERK